ncbi:hypothetical protein C8R44DRAFT_894289 [Mycena epipterygia]|nr:hypothetical protein C8R44DRAFT_894289 [Mycena epipterygia]
MVNYSWNWGLPDVQIPHPPVENSADMTTAPPAYYNLKFNPLGLYNLCWCLGVLVNKPGQFTAFQERFNAADLAWLASGASEDDQHFVDPAKFLPALFTSRHDVGSLFRGFDHNPSHRWDYGTKTLLTPDRLEAHIHLPPHFINEHPQSHLAIAHIVQTFIEHVGIPTVARWKRAAHARGWALSQSGQAGPAHPPAAQLFPVPSSGMTHYIYTFSGITSGPGSPHRLGVIVEYEDREDRLLECEQQAQLQDKIKHLTERLKVRPIPSTVSSSLRSPPFTLARRTGATATSPTPGRPLATRFPTLALRTNLGPTTEK